MNFIIACAHCCVSHVSPVIVHAWSCAHFISHEFHYSMCLSPVHEGMHEELSMQGVVHQLDYVPNIV